MYAFMVISGSNHQVEQLQILYAARGRKLEELTEQLKTLKDNSDREIRILKHKLTLAQGIPILFVTGLSVFLAY